MRWDMPLSVDSSLKWDLKGKKKIVFPIRGLLSDKDHFNVLDHYFPGPPIPYTSTPEFHASTPPSIFDKTYISVEQGTHESNLSLDRWDIYRIQEVEHRDVDTLNTFFDKESNEYFSYCIGAFMLQSDSSTSIFNHSYWMIDSGCTDHLLPFIDDFVYLGDQKWTASVANGNKVSMYGPGTILIQ